MFPGALAAVLIAVTAEEEGPVSFEKLVRESTAIVVGRITRTRPGPGFRIATLSVELQVKGRAAAAVELTIRPPSDATSDLGQRALYFLVPDQTSAGAFKPVLGRRSVFGVFRQTGIPTVYVTAAQVDVGGGPGVPTTEGEQFPRPIPLQNVLRALGAAPAPSRATRGAQYEAMEVSCERCVLAAEVAKEIHPGAVDCGMLGPDAGQQRACVAQSLRLRRPFRAGQWTETFEGPSEESFIIARDGGTMVLTHADYSGGTAVCQAMVLIDSCVSFRLDAAHWQRFLHCEPTSPFTPTRRACSEGHRRTLALSSAKPASGLRCAQAYTSGTSLGYAGCSSSQDAGHRLVPRLDAGDYLCLPALEAGELNCELE